MMMTGGEMVGKGPTPNMNMWRVRYPIVYPVGRILAGMDPLQDESGPRIYSFTPVITSSKEQAPRQPIVRLPSRDSSCSRRYAVGPPLGRPLEPIRRCAKPRHQHSDAISGSARDLQRSQPLCSLESCPV